MAAAHVQKRPKRSADHIPRSLDEFMERHNVVKEKRSHAKCPAPYYRNFFLTNYSLMKLDCYIRDVIAADGKETHNTGKKNSKDPTQRRNLNEFNVMSTEWGISLSSTRIDEKSNEIPEMQKVMKQIDCRGCVVTADAMNTQKATAKAIIKEAHGDYCLALKENQRTVYLEVREYFAYEELLKEILTKEGRYFKEIEETTCNTITREYFITDDDR